MKTQNSKSIEENNTLDILDEIQEVRVSPFFKNKVLNKIREQEEEKVPLFGWFSPQLQLAAVVNHYACYQRSALVFDHR